MGLSSRDGIAPLNMDRDVGGPMARTVADAVAVLDVIVGYDSADPVTERSEGRIPAGGYAAFLDPAGLEGKRIGVLRRFFEVPDAESDGPRPSPVEPTAQQGQAAGCFHEQRSGDCQRRKWNTHVSRLMNLEWKMKRLIDCTFDKHQRKAQTHDP
jgi:Asp-tRNA(Asn)/Glu-tRNA(Gln) amidotransferase A subunit family amidase